jgi:hypothetical protein
MLFDPKHEQYLGRLEAELRRARSLTPELMSDVIAEGCARFAPHAGPAKLKIERLIGVRAWTDAALALIAFELPQWKLRRILYEDGGWHCSLSRQPQLPMGLDEVAEGSHEALPLAVLIALLQALRDHAGRGSGVTRVPRPWLRHLLRQFCLIYERGTMSATPTDWGENASDLSCESRRPR